MAPGTCPRCAAEVTQAQTLRLACVLPPGTVLYAPNAELVEMLRRRTGKPVFLMKRGIDTELFHPMRRTVDDGVLRLGYVGRITAEKSVRFLKELETALNAAGTPPFRFLVVGDGSDRHGSAIWPPPTFLAFAEARSWRATTPIWTSLPFRRVRTRSGTWCSRPSLRACRL